MNYKFWASLVLFLFLPLVAIFIGGFAFFESYQSASQEKFSRQLLKQEQEIYFKGFENKIFFLEEQALLLLKERRFANKSPFLSLVKVDPSKKEILDELFVKNQEEWKKDVKSSIHKIIRKTTDPFQFDILVLDNKKRIPFVLIDSSYLFPNEKSSSFFLGFLKNKSLFDRPQIFSQKGLEKKEIFIVNHQGRILFHNHQKHLLKKLSKNSPIRLSLKDAASENREEWSLRSTKKNKTKEISYVRSVNKSNLFLVNKGKDQLALSASPWLLKWGLFSTLIFIIFFIGLVWIVYPLFSAYNHLKKFFIYFSKTGEIPSWSYSIKNPFLYFYNNREEIFQRRSQMDKNSENTVEEKSFKTFQTVLEEEVKKIKFKYSGMNIIKKIEDDVRLWNFENFMRTVLHELLLNAVESMGAYDRQDIHVSSKEEGGYFVFSISDQGIGLSKSEQNKIFELYYSTKSKVGVGLNLVQSIVSSNHGTIEFVSSKDQKGVEVIVKLPSKCFLNVSVSPKHLPFRSSKVDKSSTATSF